MECPKRLGIGPNDGTAGVHPLWEVLVVSIVRIGLAETKKFAEGYAAIFGGKKKKDDKPTEQEAQGKQESKKTAKDGKKKDKK
jgi:hypothetical protein